MIHIVVLDFVIGISDSGCDPWPPYANASPGKSVLRLFGLRTSEFGFPIAIPGSHARPKSDSRCPDTTAAEIHVLPGKQSLGNKNGFAAFPEQPQALAQFL